MNLIYTICNVKNVRWNSKKKINVVKIDIVVKHVVIVAKKMSVVVQNVIAVMLLNNNSRQNHPVYKGGFCYLGNRL